LKLSANYMPFYFNNGELGRLPWSIFLIVKFKEWAGKLYGKIDKTRVYVSWQILTEVIDYKRKQSGV